jgi:hypothetical protein
MFPVAASALDTLIFFVTSTGNSRCRTCFYWEELNRKDHLSFRRFDPSGRRSLAGRLRLVSAEAATTRVDHGVRFSLSTQPSRVTLDR